MTIRTPNWESGRVILPESRAKEIAKDVEEALPIKESSPRGMNKQWPLHVKVVGDLLYWYVEPHETSQNTPEYLLAKTKVKQSLAKIQRWPSSTGGAITGEAGFLQAFGSLGKDREASYKEAAKDVRSQFRMLRGIWYRDSKGLELEDMLKHPAHEKIIGLGQEIIPLIMEEIKEGRGWWFTALKIITGENPEPTGSSMEERRNVWLQWYGEK